MEKSRDSREYNLLVQILLFSFLLLIIANIFKLSMSFYFHWNTLYNFSTVFLSIVLEGMPFIIIGALASSLIQIFISENLIARIIPRNSIVGLLLAGLVGILFPVCECAVIPITRRLIKKGMPIGMAVTFMLAVPIINPIVILSTYYAFMGHASVTIARAGLGFVCALCIGLLISHMHNGSVLKENTAEGDYFFIHGSGSTHTYGSCGCGQYHERKRNIISHIIGHTSSEMYDIGKFFIIGAILSSAMQTFIPRNYILSVGSGSTSSILVMMVMAFILSICSETDAFIARTFLSQFTKGSVIAFLIFGPMIDIKNTMMLSGSFKAGFTIKLIFLIFSVCFIASALSNILVFL
jgi:uncharacterized protein